MMFLPKVITLLTTCIKCIHIFTYRAPVTSLSTVDLTPNFPKSNYIYPYYKWYKLRSDITKRYSVLRIIIQTFDENFMLHHYPALVKVR